MGIDIYAKWRNQSEAEKAAQIAGLDITKGNTGYLREAYHGEPYVTQFLLKEAFDETHPAFEEGRGVPIPSAQMRERLPRAIDLAIQRQQEIYGISADKSFEVISSFVEFVELCEAKERQNNEPCYVYASY